MATAAGIDRGRVGERLQAALAGLHELHMLREKQGDMVTRALRADQDEPSRTPAVQSSNAARGSMLANEEQRLEATLTALKQQLVGGRSPLLSVVIVVLFYCCVVGPHVHQCNSRSAPWL